MPQRRRGGVTTAAVAARRGPRRRRVAAEVEHMARGGDAWDGRQGDGDGDESVGWEEVR